MIDTNEGLRNRICLLWSNTRPKSRRRSDCCSSKLNADRTIARDRIIPTRRIRSLSMTGGRTYVVVSLGSTVTILAAYRVYTHTKLNLRARSDTQLACESPDKMIVLSMWFCTDDRGYGSCWLCNHPMRPEAD